MITAFTSKEVVKMLRSGQPPEKNDREYAEAIGISPAYLSDIYAGKREPGKKILKRLRLRRMIAFVGMGNGKR
jgi:transcriptional regulator with XRE-family HTH domain